MARTQKPDPKFTALQESGTVNPHAQDIDDPAFAAGDFFDPRDLVQTRYEMLRRVHTEGLAIADVAADEVMRFIEETRAAQARLDAQVLVEQIAERFGLSVHRRTVARALARSKKKLR